MHCVERPVNRRISLASHRRERRVLLSLRVWLGSIAFQCESVLVYFSAVGARHVVALTPHHVQRFARFHAKAAAQCGLWLRYDSERQPTRRVERAAWPDVVEAACQPEAAAA
jgi:hypothetical protein